MTDKSLRNFWSASYTLHGLHFQYAALCNDLNFIKKISIVIVSFIN
jgi:hypothetical protein